MVGLIWDEAHGGCGLITLYHEWLVVGALCRVSVGSVHSLKAEIAFCQEIDPEVIKVGIKFLE